MMASTSTVHAQEAPLKKFSRYRSVRRADANHEPTCLPSDLEHPASPSENASVARSRSRYHKKPKAAAASPVSSPPLPRQSPSEEVRVIYSHCASLAALNGEPYPDHVDETAEYHVLQERTTSGSKPTNNSPIGFSQAARTPASSRSRNESDSGSQMSWEHIRTTKAQELSKSHFDPRQEAKDILAAEDARLRRMKAQQNAAREAKSSRRRIAEAGEGRRQERIEAPERIKHAGDQGSQEHARRLYQRPLQDERGQVEKDKDAARMAREEEDEKEKRAREDAAAVESRAAVASNSSPSKKQPFRKVLGSLAGSTPPDGPAVLFAMPRDLAMDPPIQRKTTSPKGFGPPPALGAPISAANAGERSVLIRCDQSSVTLAVTLTSTAEQLLNCALTSMPQTVDPQKSVLKESFSQLGLERPIRKYERIRDVMNSWDNDSQNILFIVLDDLDSAENLETSSVPRDQPGDTVVYMYHSQRPGKWDKRWITLKTDGQVSVSKKQGGDASDARNICHISDFDVYIPTHHQLTKKIKPPKKLCFAIKSQQKSNLFLDGRNYLHFFSTNDKAMAAEWYNAVHSWRSWYLVNIMGEGQPKSTSEPQRFERSHSACAAEPTRYTIGSSAPLQTTDGDKVRQHDLPAKDLTPVEIETLRARKMPDRTRNAPPTSFPTGLLTLRNDSAPPAARPVQVAHIANQPTSLGPESPTFVPPTILGHTCSQGKKASLANKPRTNSMPSSYVAAPLATSVTSGTSLRRNLLSSTSQTTKPKPQPLIDLTPQYLEPPQHVRKGRGFVPEPGKQLVDLATEPESQPGAIHIPPARTWRRPPPATPLSNNINSPESSTAIKEPPRLDLARSATARQDEEAFTGYGLLARSVSKPAKGASGTGVDMRTGGRNARGKPLIDLQLTSQFQHGSLLRQVEVHEGVDERGLVVDREKNIEVQVPVGDGL